MSNLTTLHTEVIAHVDRADITLAQVATFSKLARMTLERAKFLPKFLRVTTTLPVVGNTFDIPTDSLGIINCWLHTGTNTTKLERKDEKFVRGQANSNIYYWREGSAAYMRAAPSAGSTIRLRYIQAQTDMVAGIDTNAWAVKGYDVLFWCVVMHTELFRQDEASAAVAEKMYLKALDDLELFELYESHSDDTSESGDYIL